MSLLCGGDVGVSRVWTMTSPRGLLDDEGGPACQGIGEDRIVEDQARNCPFCRSCDLTEMDGSLDGCFRCNHCEVMWEAAAVHPEPFVLECPSYVKDDD